MCQQLLNIMNLQLQNLFQTHYTPTTLHGAPDSVILTNNLRPHIIEMFKKYNINSIFDAGCNNCIWMNELLKNIDLEYHGGDISHDMIAYVHEVFPDYKVQVHDVTTDALPDVDLLFVRDVAIHLNNIDKRQLWNNWLHSSIPWIMITHNKDSNANEDIENYDWVSLQTSGANWQLEPWSFPEPVDQAWEYRAGGRCMALWNQNQFNGTI